MKNPRITPKERGLIKGSIRRVFSRSDIRREVVQEALIEHKDPTRPRVTKWAVCASCEKPTPAYKGQVDHCAPVIPVDTTLEEMSWDDLVNRIWCDKDNLDFLCPTCHDEKSSRERKLRNLFKKGKQKK